MNYTDTLLSERDVQKLYHRAVYSSLTSHSPQSIDHMVWKWVEEVCEQNGNFEEVPHDIVNLWYDEVIELVNELAEKFKPTAEG